MKSFNQLQNSKKGDLIETIVVVIFGIFIFLIFSPVMLDLVSSLAVLDVYENNNTLLLFLFTIPFIAFIGIIISVFRMFRGGSGGFGGD